MTAFKFKSRGDLRSILDNVETVQQKNINEYSWGHLNEKKLNRQQLGAGGTKAIWKGSIQQRPVIDDSDLVPVVEQRGKSEVSGRKMRDTLFDFSVGTTGSVPVASKEKHSKPLRRQKVEEFKKDTARARRREQEERPASSNSNASSKSMYTQLDDGVLIEELRPQEIMLKSPRVHLSPLQLPKKTSAGDDDYDIMEELTQTLDRDGLLTLRHTFLPSHTSGITKSDQFNKLKHFESNVLRKQDSEEQKVLSGIKAVEHLEKRLEEDLDMMNLNGMGPNFHKLQIYSNSFEDLIDETPTFGFILKCIKSEYDNYITRLLDSQTPQHSRLLRDQVEQMAARGTSRPQELQEAKDRVQRLETDAKEALEENERLRSQVLAEEEWLATAPEPEPPQITMASLFADPPPAELAEELEHGKALILEKLDALKDLRLKLRLEFVPLTVCTHLEQCIKETEIEVQKLLKQNEYFERSNNEMEAELKDSINDADTSERDARRIWKKVNSLRGLPRVHLNREEGAYEDSDNEDDDESKWNWYIS